MRVLGLTGGIAMGKSTAAAAFRAAGIPVFDADRTVHALQSRGGAAIAAIAAIAPDAIVDGAVSRPRLRAAIAADPALLGALETILHPLVGRARRRFLARARRAGHALCVLDVPLLFETGGDRACDLTVAVSAPRPLQLARIVQRRGMSVADAARLVARQMEDRERRRRADLVILTGLSRGHTRAHLDRLIADLRALPPCRRSSLNRHHKSSMRRGMKRPRRAFRSPETAGTA